jgi:BirA family biotin operon repressor/biotin-[acetyl-CoA-carboxylase] ligase
MIPFAGGSLVCRRWRTFQNLALLQTVESSNDLARELIELYFGEEQDLPATVLVADSQPGARGRTGRWHAPRGRGLYFTFVVRGEGVPLSVLPIAVARWLRESLSESTGVVAELKWPNDLYVGRRKLAGILAEGRTQGRDAFVAVGVGINVSGPAAALGLPDATTLEEEAGRPVPLALVLQALLDRLDAELTSPNWREEIRRWEKASLHRPGDRMTVRREGQVTRGEYLGLDASGFLRLKTESGEAVVSAGEVAEW